ncbi:hypothetical protein [Paraburkholderia sp. JHI869]|uniref:hypothetical protein n=1 Tax=Paraburkholderia sp. JHI869 TaxID=3112959 RepID=UPI0031766345
MESVLAAATLADDSPERVESDATRQYLDDLEAANRFKTFLLGIGVEVPADVIEGLARLTEALVAPEKISKQETSQQAMPAHQGSGYPMP